MKFICIVFFLFFVSTSTFSQTAKTTIPFIATCMLQFQNYYNSKSKLEQAMDVTNCKETREQCNQKLRNSYNDILLTIKNIEKNLINLKEVDVELDYKNIYLSFFNDLKNNYLTYYPILIEHMKYYGTPQMKSKEFSEVFFTFMHKERSILEKYGGDLTTDRFFKKHSITPAMLKEYMNRQ